jgi:Tol biopolymer transport system component
MTALIRRTRLLAALLVLTCASTASAQYFGRNKVQYKKFDFEVMKTEHFDIYFYPAEREGAELAARLSERWHARLEKLFGHQLRGRQPLVLYASHPDFEQTNTTGGEIGEGTGGFTEPLRRRIVLPMGGPLADTDHVIGHELVHAFQFDITTRPNSAPGETGANSLPLWFIEGMAEYLTLGPIDSHTAMWLRDAVRQDARTERDKTAEKLPTLDDLNDAKYFPYRWGHAFWAYVGGRWGDHVIGDMLRIAAGAGDPEPALRRIFGLDRKQFSAEWQAAMRSVYQPVLASTVPPEESGRLTIKGEKLGGDLNVGPSISPDGRRIAFLSERSLFSIDLFVADAATGNVLRRLTKTSTDPHYSSLQFIYSAGTWDPESRRIAIATVTAGRAAIAIFDAETGAKEREIQVDGVDEILNPTWAPDGQAIAFTGMTRGLTDLYMFDLRESKATALTSDPYADIHPAWSPDGRRIAFATDRFTSRLEELQIGAYRLAILDLPTRQIEPVEGSVAGRAVNPQWAPDGRALYFMSDRDGITNLYRVIPGESASQLTTLATGVSGITASSPALSVSSRSGVAAFTVYDQGNYHIYTRNLSDMRPVAASRTSEAAASPMSAAVLPPRERQASDVAAVLEKPAEGLPAAQSYEVSDYKAGLQLETVGQPFIGIGADRFGTAIGGGLSFTFADMLGNHNLATAFQIEAGVGGSYSFKNTAAQAFYLNQANRWNWGLIGGQVPYLSGGIRSTLGQVGNELVIIDETILFRQTDLSAATVVAYPFDRSRRLEFQGGVSRITFDEIVQTEVYSARTGQLLARDSQETSLATPLSLATSSAAFVFDTSNFGATSPVQGARYRFEAAPTFGTINYASMLADYRRYFMPLSFYTIATRVVHYGRYGSGGQDSRLYPLFLGYPSLVRGYDMNSFGVDECVPTAASDCPAFDRLLGSRLLVGNVEFRFPLLRPFGVSRGMYGPLPVEVALFADGGVAWDGGERPDFLGGTREAVSSTGVAFRVNLMGFAVGELAFSRPLQRPGRGWLFQFNLSPGF